MLIQYTYSHPLYLNLSRTHETYRLLAESSSPARLLVLLLVYLILLKGRDRLQLNLIFQKQDLEGRVRCYSGSGQGQVAGSGECENKGNILPSRGIVLSVQGLCSMLLVSQNGRDQLEYLVVDRRVLKQIPLKQVLRISLILSGLALGLLAGECKHEAPKFLSAWLVMNFLCNIQVRRFSHITVSRRCTLAFVYSSQGRRWKLIPPRRFAVEHGCPESITDFL